MGLNIELDIYFNITNLKAVLDQNPESVVLSIKTVNVQENSQIILIAKAVGYDASNNQMSVTADGCPTPCKPGGGTFQCQEASENLLNSFRANHYFNLF